MTTVTDVRWTEDLNTGYGFSPSLAVEFKIDGKWNRYGVMYRSGKKEEARKAILAWAAERGVDLNEAQDTQ